MNTHHIFQLNESNPYHKTIIILLNNRKLRNFKFPEIKESSFTSVHPLEKREREQRKMKRNRVVLGCWKLEVCESDANANVLLDAWPPYLFNSWQSTVTHARWRTILGVYHYPTQFGVRWEFHINWAGWAYIQLGHAGSSIEDEAHIDCFFTPLFFFFFFQFTKKKGAYTTVKVDRDFSCGRPAQCNSRPTLVW